jgi:hypothetical protein
MLAKQAAHRRFLALLLASLLYLTPVKRASGESFFDVKVMQYSEDDGRIEVFSPAILFQHEWSPRIGIRIDGVYNTISGASPTGAPPVPLTRVETIVESVQGGAAESFDDDHDDDDHDDDDDEDEEERNGRLLGISGPFHAATGATSVSAPASGPSRSTTTTREVPTGEYELPTADVEDTRMGANVELYGIAGAHHLSGKLSYSTEDDYESIGMALSDGIQIGESGTTLTLGGAYTQDRIDVIYLDARESKRTIDAIVGIHQIINARTVLQANYAVGKISGFLNDPYKVVELNGILVPERRPGDRDRQVAYVALTRSVDALRGVAEASFRRYDDSFDITGTTLSLAWFQRVGDGWIVRPRLRWHHQDAASFYDVRFSGEPEYYSSDYRVSELESLSYGVKLVWHSAGRISMDVGIDRYVQTGKDGVTFEDAYPAATVFTAGGRVWF